MCVCPSWIKSASGIRVSRLSSQSLFHYKAWKLVNVCAVCHFLWMLAGNQAKWKENPQLCSLHCPPPSEVGWAEIRRVRQTHSGRLVRADRSHLCWLQSKSMMWTCTERQICMCVVYLVTEQDSHHFYPHLSGKDQGKTWVWGWAREHVL